MYEKGKLRVVDKIDKVLGKNRLQDLGFDIPNSKITARQAIALSKTEEEQPSTSDIVKADEI